jgi:hypothetical protein
VKFANASSNSIKYLAFSGPMLSAFECLIKLLTICLALFVSLIHSQPLSVRVNFEKTVAAAFLTAYEGSSSMEFKFLNEYSIKCGHARLWVAKAPIKIAACSLTSSFWCLRRDEAIPIISESII